MCFGLSLQAQTANDDWKLVHSEGGIEFYKQLTNCDLPNEGQYANYYILKIVNTLEKPIQVQWKNNIFYDGICTNCTENYLPQFQLIEAKSSIQGDCSSYANQYLRIFDSWNNKSNPNKLTGYRISNVTIKDVL